jgi:hypothetical protein
MAIAWRSGPEPRAGKKEQERNKTLDVRAMFQYHIPIIENASTASHMGEGTMSVPKFLTEFLGFTGLVTTLFGWTMLGHIFGL